jgi:hypothetical protein
MACVSKSSVTCPFLTGFSPQRGTAPGRTAPHEETTLSIADRSAIEATDRARAELADAAPRAGHLTRVK